MSTCPSAYGVRSRVLCCAVAPLRYTCCGAVERCNSLRESPPNKDYMPHRVQHAASRTTCSHCCGRRARAPTSSSDVAANKHANETMHHCCNECNKAETSGTAWRGSAGWHWAAIGPGAKGPKRRGAVAHSAAPAGAARRGCMLHVALCRTGRRCSPLDARRSNSRT